MGRWNATTLGDMLERLYQDAETNHQRSQVVELVCRLAIAAHHAEQLTRREIEAWDRLEELDE